MRKRTGMVTSEFYCPVCKCCMPLPRNKARQRERGHIKDLFCPRCKQLRKFTEVGYNLYYKNALGEVM